MTGLSAFITRWYRKLDGAKVYDKEYFWNIVCKLVHRIFRSFILSGQFLDMNIWGVILVLNFTPTSGLLFVPMQLWHN